MLDFVKAYEITKRHGIRSTPTVYVNSADDAVKFSKGRPIVLKVMSQKAMHKAKSGLVMLNLQGEDGIRGAYNALSKKAAKFKPYKILAQHMVGNGIEIIIGGNTDPQFGKMLLVGLGGIYVETFKDFALRVCPITAADARSMLHQLRSSKVIAPDSASSAEIEELIMKASKMFANTDITELDLNPVILHDGTYDAVDFRMVR